MEWSNPFGGPGAADRRILSRHGSSSDGPVLERMNVGQILRPPGRPLVPQQLGPADEGYREAGHFVCHPAGPCLPEDKPRRVGHDVDMARRQADLEFLNFVLRGSVSVVVCPARGIGRMRLPLPLRAPLEDGRLLLLSCFPDDVRRPTRQIVAKRNTQVAALAHCLLVPHAEPGGKVEQLCQEVLGQHKRVFTLASAGSRLGNLGATKLHPGEAARALAAAPQRDER